jgi:hypothetical protein
VNVLLFTATRRVLPPKSIIPGRYVISRPTLVEVSIEDDPDAYYRTDPIEKTPTSIFKRSDSYISDSGSDLSIPNEHGEGLVRQPPDIPHVQTPVTARPNHSQSVRESTPSMYDMYAESEHRRSEMPRITDVSLDEKYDS